MVRNHWIGEIDITRHYTVADFEPHMRKLYAALNPQECYLFQKHAEQILGDLYDIVMPLIEHQDAPDYSPILVENIVKLKHLLWKTK